MPCFLSKTEFHSSSSCLLSLKINSLTTKRNKALFKKENLIFSWEYDIVSHSVLKKTEGCKT